MAIFNYQEPAPTVFKPWVPVRLGYAKTHRIMKIPIMSLIDSGADVNFCLLEIARYLGISKLDPKLKREFTAADNKSFYGFKYNLNLYFMSKSLVVPFYIVEELPKGTPIILGQNGFFDKFTITFNFQNKTIEILDPNNPQN